MGTADVAVRIIGAVLAWLLLGFSMTLLVESAKVMADLGGFCAVGGPYLVTTACPSSIMWALPVSIVGGFLAVGIGLVVAGGFGTPVYVWAWPILFIGLGLGFIRSGTPVNIAIGLFSLALGIVPAVIELSSSARAAAIGSVRADGRPFVAQDRRIRSLHRLDPGSGRPVAATIQDAELSIAITALSAAAGVALAIVAFAG